MGKYKKQQLHKELHQGMKLIDVLQVLEKLRYKVDRKTECEPGSPHHLKVYIFNKDSNWLIRMNSHLVLSFNSAERLVDIDDLKYF